MSAVTSPVTVPGVVRLPGTKTQHPRYTLRCCDCGAAFEASMRTARWCLECRYVGRTGRSRHPKYPLTPLAERLLRERYDSSVKGRAGELARLLGWPKWAVKRQAAALGLCKERPEWRHWTPEEDALLDAEGGRRTYHWLAHRLRRSAAAVTLRMKRLRISRRERSGWYTAAELGACMGHDPSTVGRWIRRGELAAKHRGTLAKGDPWVIEESAVREFLRSHPLAWDIRKVDQLWFVDLVFGGAVQ